LQAYVTVNDLERYFSSNVTVETVPHACLSNVVISFVGNLCCIF